MKKINILTKELLEELYLKKRKTLKEITVITGIKSDITIRKYMNLYNIKIRDPNTERKKNTMKGMSDSEFSEYLKDLYFNKKMSCNKIAQKLDVSHSIVYRYFDKYNIQKLSRIEAIKAFSTGKNNPKWNNGRTIKDGYVQIYCPNHPSADSKGFVYEHRYIMEQHIGRYLESSEIVHHENEIKDDNRIENLRLFKSNEEHIKHHFEQNNLRLNTNNYINSFKKGR